jgi:hypothetical protein
MRIREYTSNDLRALRRMHAAQGFCYPFPDLESPLFISKLVLEEDEAENGEETRLKNGEIAGREVIGRNSPPERGSRTRASGAKSLGITMAILQRLTVETYLLHDPDAGSPPQRWHNFQALHDAAVRDAALKGLDDAQAFLPPQIARSFGRRLARLGWTRDPWPCFSRRV